MGCFRRPNFSLFVTIDISAKLLREIMTTGVYESRKAEGYKDSSYMDQILVYHSHFSFESLHKYLFLLTQKNT